MGTPEPKDLFASLYTQDACEIVEDVTRRFQPSETRILDVGAGWGKYKMLLREYEMDAVEIWEPYVLDNDLWSTYEKVYVDDVCNLEPRVFDDYDVVIFGDVLEHIERDKAKCLLLEVVGRVKEVYVAVPYQYPQGMVEGNEYERHIQDDLTPALMTSAYPMLKRLFERDGKAVYVKCV
jgi:hypothetical protein